MQVKSCLKVVLESWDYKFLIYILGFQKSNIGWPQQPLTEKVLKFNMIFYDYIKKIKNLKHQNKAEFKNLDDSEVLSNDFSGLRTSAASLTSPASATSMASTASKALFHQKNFLVLIVGSSLAPKWPILAPFRGMNHQKSKFSLISYTLSVGGCRGQPMLLFWKPSMFIKNFQSQDSQTTFKQDLTCIFLSVRANS